MEIPTTLNSILFYYFYLLVFFCSSFHFCHASDTILPGQSLTREQTLISPGEKFVLGFFTPGKSQNLYIGIWFNKIQPLTVVWVANRKNPITDSSIGVLQFTNNGNLVVLSNTTILWSTDVSVPARSAKLLDSGNLVLLDGNNSGTFLWQSFDYPTDTYIPGMKIGRNLKTNLNWSLTSWRTSDDPSPGNFTLELDISGLPHFLILKGNDIYWSAGLWDGQGWSGVAKKDGEYIKDHNFISNSDEVYYIDSVYNRSVIYRVFLDKTGVLQQATWNEAGQVWMLFWSGPRSSCQLYGACGPFGVCNADALQFCRCLSGFVPKHQRDWEMNKWSSGCVRETALKCGKEDGLLRLSGFKLPDIATNAQVDGSLSLNECREKCLNSCSCTAYASSDVQGGGSGCVIWSGDLIDLQNASQGHQEFYLRLSASELGTTNETRSSRGSFTRKMTLAFAIATPLFGILLLVVWCRCSCVRNKKKKKIQGEKGKEDVGGEESSEFTLFNFCTIEAATDNFSDTNKLGEGGFGPVYKGKMENGLEIAVKRLSKSSGQGMVEFENEVRLMAKLQHRNLVRLLGCCTHGEEKILIYEYMPNKSLDSFLFDHTVSSLLDWKKRFNIIIGIARGILYLHEDSRLRIIHRDLKCSNILLDAEMNPKISDFGMARRFGRNQSKANTKKVVGTFGYMSPEYAMRGIFSEKSDIFSFGVLVLEIVSGEKSNGFYNESLSLTGYGWKLWKEGRASEFMDSSLRDSCSLWEVLRCIHIGLLCVQESPRERPNMSSILFMLSSEIDLTTPDKPAFSILTEADLASIRPKPSSTNNVTISVIEAR